MNSLQGNLLRVLVGTILLGWTIAWLALWAYLTQSETSIVDDELRGFATRIMESIPAHKDFHPPQSVPAPQVAPQSKEPKLALQIWGDQKYVVARSPNAPVSPLKPDFSDGFAMHDVEGQNWRVYSVSDITRRKFVQVGRLQSELDAALRLKAFGSLGRMTALLCFVGLLAFIAVRWSLRPVLALEHALRNRAKFDLTPLSTAALPKELQPLVESFNHVLSQLDEAVDNERRFIGDAAHELRTPLAALQAQAYVALHARSADEKDAALVKLVAVAERNTRLSEQLLDLARLNAGQHIQQREAADLSELILHVVREFEVFAEMNQRGVTLDLAPSPIFCNIDEIGILLRNLVDNALRYTQKSGRVHVRCGCIDTEAGPAPYLEVADDGPGVPSSEREAIFRRFHRVPGNGGRGSGIGLSLVAGIVQLHNARIETGTGIDGRGFSVRIQFPANPVAHSPASPYPD